MRFIIPLFALILCVSISSKVAFADIKTSVEELFTRDMDSLDIARVKIEVDHMIDPAIDVEAQLVQIDQMVATIKTMLPDNADSWAKVETIRKYIYQAGQWNGGKAFAYDHDDPYGLDVRNKLLSDYLTDKRGNCITMPFLFIILGQRLGVDVVPALAPLHVFVKFTDDLGQVHNLETTSGAGRTRDSHYRKLLPITDIAVRNGIFMKPLTNRETVAVIASVLIDDLIKRKRYQEAIAVSSVVLKHSPKFAYALVKKGTAAYYLLKDKFYTKYPNIKDVRQDQESYLAYLQDVNKSAFDRADALGWKPLKR